MPPDAQPSAAPAITVRPATPDDAAALAVLAQELLAFYGLTSPYQRSYMAHAIANGAFAETSGIEVLVAEDSAGHCQGFLAFGRMFALANCRNSLFIQDIFVTRRARAKGVGQALMAAMLALADGDGRYLLTMSEVLFDLPKGETLDVQGLAGVLQRRAPAYDKSREEHYNLISALHKSVRGSDPDAALYWLARMLNGGEDPLYLARRIVRMAVEDIGEADPLSILVANAAKDAYDFLGSPEGELALAQAVVHLATAPKSVGVYEAFKAAKKAAYETGSLAPPAHIRNAPTKLMKQLGYGKGYQYDPDTPEGFSGADFFPDEMERRTFYRPKGEGHEEKIKARLERWAEMRARMAKEAAVDGAGD